MEKLRVRLWDRGNNEFIYSDDEGYLLSLDGKIFNWRGEPLDEDNFIIQRFIGLKDNNNKDIYEGDIVVALSSDNKYKSIVQWDEYDGRWGFVSIKCGNMSFSYNLTYGCSSWEICGNIFENPELWLGK